MKQYWYLNDNNELKKIARIGFFFVSFSRLIPFGGMSYSSSHSNHPLNLYNLLIDSRSCCICAQPLMHLSCRSLQQNILHFSFSKFSVSHIMHAIKWHSKKNCIQNQNICCILHLFIAKYIFYENEDTIKEMSFKFIQDLRKRFESPDKMI